MNCKQGTKYMISQMVELLDAIEDEHYRSQLSLFKGSTIGQHFRHISDFYLCFIAGLEAGIIDYANRARNGLIETETEIAKSVFEDILRKIEQCDEGRLIDVRVDFTDEFGVERPIVTSSVGRELMYAYDHAVHHLAMIKMGVRVAFPFYEINDKIGVAPSTLKHWKGEAIAKKH